MVRLFLFIQMGFELTNQLEANFCMFIWKNAFFIANPEMGSTRAEKIGSER